MKRDKKILITVTALMAVAVVICALVIAINGWGLVEGYDFGAGAYYYADIPSFEKIMNEDSFRTSVPVWVHVGLFLLWGWAMYRLWGWIERR